MTQQSYDRQDGETTKAYAAFIYRGIRGIRFGFSGGWAIDRQLMEQLKEDGT
jgi:hypothetical protein